MRQEGPVENVFARHGGVIKFPRAWRRRVELVNN